MSAAIPELSWEKSFVHRHTTVGDVDLGEPRLNPVRIELLVPSAVERVRPVAPTAVAADLDHLRTAVEWAVDGWMGSPADNSSDPDRPRQLRVPGVADVVLPQLTSTPTRDVEMSIVNREVDVGDKRR